MERERIEREEKEEEHRRCMEKVEKEIEMMKIKQNTKTDQENKNYERASRPKLPKFDEEKDDMDTYLERFERFATVQQWNREEWSMSLSPLLTGKGLHVFTGLPADEIKDYDKLKSAILRRYELTEEGFRKRFKEERPECGEAVNQFIARIRRYLERWIDLSGIEKTFPALQDLLIKEQYINTCNKELQIFLRERVPKNVEELTAIAQQYTDAHKSQKTIKAAAVQEKCVIQQEIGQAVVQQRRCYICNRTNHIARDCYYRDLRRRQCNDSTPVNAQRNYNQRARVSENNQRNCIQRARAPDSQNKNCQRAGAFVHNKDANIKDKSGQMPVADGILNNRKVKVLRDTGCSSAVVRTCLVYEHQKTGEEVTCMLIDGTERKFPLAHIYVDTPYYTGYVKAMCMDNPLYDLIVGNLQDMSDKPNSARMEGHAVITTAQCKVKSGDFTIQNDDAVTAERNELKMEVSELRKKYGFKKANLQTVERERDNVRNQLLSNEQRIELHKDKYEQVTRDFHNLKHTRDNDMSDLAMKLKVTITEKEKVTRSYDESVGKLKGNQLENEKLEKKLKVATKSVYSPHASSHPRLAEMEQGEEINTRNRFTSLKTETEIGDKADDITENGVFKDDDNQNQEDEKNDGNEENDNQRKKHREKTVESTGTPDRERFSRNEEDDVMDEDVDEVDDDERDEDNDDGGRRDGDETGEDDGNDYDDGDEENGEGKKEKSRIPEDEKRREKEDKYEENELRKERGRRKEKKRKKIKTIDFCNKSSISDGSSGFDTLY